MSGVFGRLGIAALATTLTLAVGCTDKAQPSLANCIQSEAAGDALAAESSCKAAVAADPNSTSGKAAAVKLKDMQGAIAAARAAYQAARDAKRQAAAQASAARAAQLRAKAIIRGTSKDDECVSGGKPPHGVEITGGTYEENSAVATSMGCVHTLAYYEDQTRTPMDNYYCCP